MKYLFLLLFVSVLTLQAQSQKTMKNIYDFKVDGLEGGTIDFADLKGKAILIVNVASKCGYTPQYAELQELHKQLGDKITIIGFPANNFGGQEPGTAAQIAEFCERNYGVSFLMADKVSVKGKDQHPLYAWLVQQSGKEPSWNFCKYLISADGQTVSFFPSSVKPMDAKITASL
jgi:glutathione peroxidase